MILRSRIIQMEYDFPRTAQSFHSTYAAVREDDDARRWDDDAGHCDNAAGHRSGEVVHFDHAAVRCPDEVAPASAF